MGTERALLIIAVTNSMDMSPSWDATRPSATQYTPRLLRKTKDYRSSNIRHCAERTYFISYPVPL